MGAAWVLNKKIIPILIPPIKPEEMKGFVESTRYQAARINNENDLNDFYHKVMEILELDILSINQWGNIKSDAVKSIEEISKTRNEYKDNTENDLSRSREIA